VAHDDRTIAKEVATRTRRRSGVRLFAKQAAARRKIERVNKKSGTNRGVLKRGRSIGDAAVAAVVVTETVKGTCATVMFTDCGDAEQTASEGAPVQEMDTEPVKPF